MPRTSKNKFEIINDEIHISKEGWPLIGLTTYREDYYEELTSKTWTLTAKRMTKVIYQIRHLDYCIAI